MLIDTYTMIVPQKNTLLEYEQFYHRYGSIIRNSILTWKLLDEAKDVLPNIFVEMTQNMRRHEKDLPNLFQSIGLGYDPGDRKNYDKSIANSDIDEIKNYFNNDVGLYIEFITNRQQFMDLYTTFEETMRSYLRENYEIEECRQEAIVPKVLEKESCFIINYNRTCNSDFKEKQLDKIWKYYTLIRNLYSHSGGFIGQHFLEKTHGVKPELADYIKNDESIHIELSIFLKDKTDLFQFNFCKTSNKGKLFTISEYNLRFFRNFIIRFWETIYIAKIPIVKVKKQYRIEKNIYSFRLCQGNEEVDSLQKKDQNLTQHNLCHNISGYVCPKCEDLGIFLYKAKFKSHIDISDLLFKKKNTMYRARNVFTCPSCRSFFFPAYQEYLKQNNGFNILDLNEVDYEDMLNMFEERADINFGW